MPAVFSDTVLPPALGPVMTRTRAAELDSLKKQLDALPANASDDDRSKRVKELDAKDKSVQRDYEDLQNAEQGDFQEGFGKLLQKVGPVAVKYAEDNGFTLLLNLTHPQNQLPTLLWWQQGTDVSQAVVNAYNTSSGIGAQPPSAPSATRPRPTTPRPSAPATTPKK